MKPDKVASLVMMLATVSLPAWALKSDSKQPIYIEANNATYDDKNGESIYVGDVQVTQGSLRLNADRVVVYLTAERQPNKIVATGDPVRFQQTPEGQKEDIKGRSKRAEFYAADKRLVLIEQAVVWQGNNTISSDQIEYDSITTVVKAGKESSGSKRVHITLQPGESK